MSISTRTMNTPTGISRRAFGRGALGLLAASGAGLLATTPAHADAPSVSMETLLVAAQTDPSREQGGQTPGADASVRAVEEALVAAGLLDASLVDGSFGSSTVDAYAAFQRSLGYSGLGANGMPGQASLTKLGENRFTVVDPVSPGSQVQVDGVTLNERTRDMLEAARQKLGFGISLAQGSYNPGGTSASAGTHDGGGAVDVGGSDLSAEQRTSVAQALREVGFAAWVRTPDQGFDAYHVHGMAIADPDLAPGAFYQIADYYLGRNGLADHGPDDGPQVAPTTWEAYLRAGGAR